MRLFRTVLLIALGFILVSCLSLEAKYIALSPRTVPIENLESISIKVDSGDVSILGTDDQQLQVGGRVQVQNGIDLQIVSLEKQVEVSVADQHGILTKSPVKLVVRVPHQLKVNLETNSADIQVKDFNGDLVVASTSGDIIVDNVNGKITLQSNRGDVTVQKSSGTINVVGNYGQLKAQDVKGDTAISTIMGTIILNGSLGDGDSARLETDHGPVDVYLSSDSGLTLVVHSTSGEVTCMVPDLSLTPRSCEGKMGSGTGALNIRTVSGAVTIRLSP